MVNVGVIGFGKWGSKLARALSVCGKSRLVAIADINESQLRTATDLYQFVSVYTDYRQILSSTNVNAVVIAVPVVTPDSFCKYASNAACCVSPNPT